jgi:hypothetical protein
VHLVALPSQMFLSGSVLSTKLYYLWSMIFRCQSSERLVFLLLVVGH